MSILVANLPPRRVYVRKEFLTDFTSGHGEYVEGYWSTVKSVPGRSLYFETYLPQYGALYDKLPLNAFMSEPYNSEVVNSWPIYMVQYWDALDHGVTVIEKQILRNTCVEVLAPDKSTHIGTYWFTIDFYNPPIMSYDGQFAHNPEEHKSANVIALSNGIIVAYPNNRCKFFDSSLSPNVIESSSDLRASTRVYSSDKMHSHISRYGASDTWSYSTQED